MKIENDELVLTVKGKTKRVPVPAVEADSVLHVWGVPEEYRKDGVFVSVVTNGQPVEVPACSQTEAAYIGSVELEANEAARLAAAKAAKLDELNVACDAAVTQLMVKYPEAEVLSWPQQIKEAEAVLVKGAEAQAPMLEAIASARGLTVDDLAQRVLAKMQAYSHLSGALFGARQAAEDAIEAAAELADLDAVELAVPEL